MKKRLLSMLLAATMVLSLAACGDTKTPASSKADPTPTKATVKATEAVKATATPTFTPTPVPVEEMKFSQAPSIKATAKVEDRIPTKNDVFVEQVDANGDPLEIGVYGDNINLLGSSSGWNCSRAILESIIHYNTDGTYYPNVIKEYSYNADYTVWTFKLREGMKWSDGEPFTADDIVFWYEACHKTNFDTKASWTALRENDKKDGDFAVLKKVNDYEVTWTFQNPKYPASFIENGDFKWCWAPEHYLKDMIPNSVWSESKLTDEEALQNAQKKGLSFSTIKDLGKQVAYYFWNWPGIPTLNSYVLSTADGVNNYKGNYCEFLRNEYFWKVDAEGQQLPYCDKITYTMTSAEGQDLLLFRDGSLDVIGIEMKDISSTLADMNGRAVLRTFAGTNWGSYQVTFNYTSKDANYATLFANPAFRQAMSISVDRSEVSGLLSDNFLEPGQCCPSEGNFGYDEEWTKKWTEYDVAAAKKLLESCGLKMGKDGFYDFADGSDLILTFYYYTDSGNDKAYTVLSQYWAKAGIKSDVKELSVDAFDQAIDNNDWVAVVGPHTAIGGLGLNDRVAPFAPVAQAAEWYGDYGTYYQTSGESGIKPTGDMAKLVELCEKWQATPDKEAKDEIALQMYEIHKNNLWSIAYLEGLGSYSLINSKIHNYPDNLVSADLYQYANIAHYWTFFKK
ncbi:MAG: hypothetical protein IJS80_05985 [Lachnospiraceae bacterium]|nr:hypothetical protein [Lachnospiraceae bacterium]